MPQKVQKKQRESQPLPLWEKSFLIAKASLGSKMFNGEIYNGSDWTITSITFRVVAKEKSGSLRWDRKFREAIKISPLATSYFAVNVIEGEGIGSFDWSVDEILGYEGR